MIMIIVQVEYNAPIQQVSGPESFLLMSLIDLANKRIEARLIISSGRGAVKVQVKRMRFYRIRMRLGQRFDRIANPNINFR